MNGVVVLVAVIATLLAVAFFLSARTARATLKVRDEELARVRAAEEAAKKSAVESKGEAKERREEASALRAELSSVKKKAFDQAEAAKRAGGALALREEIDKLGARLAEARAEAEAHGARVKTLEKELERVLRQAQDERARAQAERAERPAPRQVESAPAPVTAAPAGIDEAALKLERDRADKAEAKLAETRKKVAELEAAVKNVRGRLETEKRVYMVQKSELELATDRYGELRRRHDGLRKDYDELIEAVRQAAREEQRTATPPVPAVSAADEKVPS